MKAVLIGFGEVGSSLFEVFSKYHTIGINDPAREKKAPKGTYDVMLVAIPYNEQFEKVVQAYQDEYKPRCTIIFSSVAIGTSRRLGAVHSPIEGVHPRLAYSIRNNPRWIGGSDMLAIKFFTESGFTDNNLVIVGIPEWTEFLKLRSTSLYGVNIEFARYTKTVADEIKMSFAWVHKYDKWYNTMYQNQSHPEYQRYVLTPPVGNIGGHCVVPNAKILDEQYPSPFLKEIYKKKEQS